MYTTCHTHDQGGHHYAEEVTRSDNKATSMARYKRVSHDMIEGMMTVITFNAFHQTS